MLHVRRFPGRRARAGFTLLELIVVILIVGVLAGIAVVAFDTVTARAQGAAATANLRQIATAVVARHTADGKTQLERPEFLAALQGNASVAVNDGLGAAGAWTLYGSSTSPHDPSQFAVGFDTGAGTPVSDTAGTRAVVLTSTGSATYARVIVYGAVTSAIADGSSCAVPTGTTPAQALSDPAALAGCSGGSGSGSGSGGGGGTGDFGTIAATAQVQDQMQTDGTRYEEVWVNLSVVPAQTAADTGVSISCTTNPELPAPGGAPDGVYDNYDGTWDAYWGEWGVNLPQVDRLYTCTVVASDASGTALARKTVTASATPSLSAIIGGTYAQPTVVDTGFGDGSSSIDGTRMAVGAPDANSNTGMVYVEALSTSGAWYTEATLTPPNPQTGEQFGYAVAISGDTIVVGAPKWSHDVAGTEQQGIAYVYVRNADATWSLQSTLGYGEINNALMGRAVAIDGDLIAVGAPTGTDAGTGLAYAYTRTGATWNLSGKLAPDVTSGSSWTGASVAVSNGTVVVGAPASDQVYVWHLESDGTWTRQGILHPSDLTPTKGADQFGYSVAVDADTLVAGAIKGANGSITGTGAAYVYVRDSTTHTWSQQQRLVGSDSLSGDQVGYSVAVEGDRVVLGSIFGYGAVQHSGAAYAYTRSGTTWTQQRKLFAPSGAAWDDYGQSVAIESGVAMITDPWGSNYGMVWTVHLS